MNRLQAKLLYEFLMPNEFFLPNALTPKKNEIRGTVSSGVSSQTQKKNARFRRAWLFRSASAGLMLFFVRTVNFYTDLIG